MTGEPDAGLQAERTVLAHWRTALAIVVVGLLVVRQSSPGVERAVAVTAAVGAGAVVVVTMVRRQRRLLRGPADPSPATVAALTAAVAALQLAALLVVL